MKLSELIKKIAHDPRLKNKLYTLIHEEGEVYVSGDDMGNMVLLKGMVRKLGKIKNIKPGVPNQAINKFRITYAYYPNSRRHQTFLRRMAIKETLPKQYRKLRRWACSMTKTFFLSKIMADGTTSEYNVIVKQSGYRDIEHFWQVCNNPKLPLPRKVKR